MSTSLNLFGDSDIQVNLVPERDLIQQLGVSRTMLWRLRRAGLPHVLVGRLIRYDPDAVSRWLAEQGRPVDGPEKARRIPITERAKADELPPCHWSPSVALDPKHRPQNPHRPASTVRREWWRFPQEAHLLDPSGRYRRLRASEVAVLQGFPAEWGSEAGLGELDRFRGLGDAVPPPLAEALFTSLRAIVDSPLSTAVEICAGFGGLALGAARALDVKHLALVERWDVACEVLRSAGTWSPEAVVHSDVRLVDWTSHAGSVDLLSGGPPCQPWSNAGKGLGLDDERDLLSFTPQLIRTLEPRAFLFENVPGLLTGDHTDYAAWLIRELRSACGEDSYGVAAAVFNAADFGLPQVRNRVFIVGIRGAEVAEIHRYFDLVFSRRTHGNPRAVLAPGLKPWRTFADSMPDWAKGSDGWRRWLVTADDNASQDTRIMSTNQNVDEAPREVRRVQLQWPSRGGTVTWTKGGWKVSDRSSRDAQRSAIAALVPESAAPGHPTSDPWLITGDPLKTLETVRRTLGKQVDLAYIDVPRLETDADVFDSVDSTARLDTWLTLVQGLLKGSMRLLADRGVLVALCGIKELPYVQILLNELGPQNHVGTIVWQKGYSPRNMRNMQEVSPTHDNLVIFARRREVLNPVALRVPPEGFDNPDRDPRGPWKAEQKGANKPDCDYEIHIPPYRWRKLEGDFPPGIWRVNERTGVIWGRGQDLTEAGSWEVAIEVSDSVGSTATGKFSITITNDASALSYAEMPWLIAARDDEGKLLSGPDASGKLRITSKALPVGRVGADYSACLIGAGGVPHKGTTRPGKTSTSGKGRFWEFPPTTLLARAAVDAVDFKKKVDAIPALKVYLDGDTSKPLNQMSLWLGRGRDDYDPFGVGYAQEAKQELEQLRALGIIREIVVISKPARLILRLIALFARPDGVVVDIGSPAGEMTAYATAAGRRAVYVELPASSGIRDAIVVPRLLCASQGRHPLPDVVMFSDEVPRSDSPKGFFIEGQRRQESSAAGVFRASLSDHFVILDREIGVAKIDYEKYPPTSLRFLAALASVEGFVPVPAPTALHFASSLDGVRRAAYVESAHFLDGAVVDRVSAEHRGFLAERGILRIYYHRGQPIEPQPGDQRLEFRRIPFDLQVMAGVV